MTETSTGKTIVLIVEDEPLIRMGVADYVSDTGFSVLEATTGDEALTILSERDDIDVVFTDVNMPGKLDGLALSGLIAERWPRIGVIVASGMVRPRRSDLGSGTLFVPKPYDLARVVESMRGLAG